MKPMVERENETIKLRGLDRTYYFEVIELGLSESNLKYLKIQERVSGPGENEER